MSDERRGDLVEAMGEEQRQKLSRRFAENIFERSKTITQKRKPQRINVGTE